VLLSDANMLPCLRSWQGHHPAHAEGPEGGGGGDESALGLLLHCMDVHGECQWLQRHALAFFAALCPLKMAGPPPDVTCLQPKASGNSSASASDGPASNGANVFVIDSFCSSSLNASTSLVATAPIGASAPLQSETMVAAILNVMRRHGADAEVQARGSKVLLTLVRKSPGCRQALCAQKEAVEALLASLHVLCPAAPVTRPFSEGNGKTPQHALALLAHVLRRGARGTCMRLNFLLGGGLEALLRILAWGEGGKWEAEGVTASGRLVQVEALRLLHVLLEGTRESRVEDRGESELLRAALSAGRGVKGVVAVLLQHPTDHKILTIGCRVLCLLTHSARVPLHVLIEAEVCVCVCVCVCVL